MLEQVLKGPKSFQINDNNINLPYNIRKRLIIPRNLQALTEPMQHQTINLPGQVNDANSSGSISNMNTHNKQLPVPYQMSQSFIKYMLFYRIVAYLTILSLFLSVISVYGGLHDRILILVNNAITMAILVAIGVRLKLFQNYMTAKKQNLEKDSIIHIIFQMLIIIPHPTIFTLQTNHYLHLLLILRIIIVLKFLIQSSVYYNVRAYRIININGLNASEHLFFAVKSLVQSLSFGKILCIQLASVLIFTHCLYLVSRDQQQQFALIDCFQIVMVTMPTVGFGQYNVPFIGQKIILFATVVNGAVLNSFVTLSMLSQLQMDQAQISSYWLLKKIETRQHIQDISKNYIQKNFVRIKRNCVGEGKPIVKRSKQQNVKAVTANTNTNTNTSINNNNMHNIDNINKDKYNNNNSNNTKGHLNHSTARGDNGMNPNINVNMHTKPNPVDINDHVRFSFRSEYQLRKILYNSISYTDINNLFAFYRDGLVQFKISCLQTANMVAVLMRALTRFNYTHQDRYRGKNIGNTQSNKQQSYGGSNSKVSEGTGSQQHQISQQSQQSLHFQNKHDDTKMNNYEDQNQSDRKNRCQIKQHSQEQ